MSLDITSYILAKNYTDKQILESNNLKVKIVNELPETGVVNTIYLVRDENGDNDNLYNEYMYVGGNFELIGAVSVDVDVTDIQINGSSIVENGVADIPMADVGISGAVVLADTAYGVTKLTNGALTLRKATDQDLSARTNGYRPIVPNNLDYAVKVAMCDGKGEDWSESEKTAARERISAISVNDIPRAVDGGEYGLIKLGPITNGLFISSTNGNLIVNAAKKTNIDNRNGTALPLTCDNLDYAVKVAMCDEKGADWSDAEKLAARMRIGISFVDNGDGNLIIGGVS